MPPKLKHPQMPKPKGGPARIRLSSEFNFKLPTFEEIPDTQETSSQRQNKKRYLVARQLTDEESDARQKGLTSSPQNFEAIEENVYLEESEDENMSQNNENSNKNAYNKQDTVYSQDSRISGGQTQKRKLSYRSHSSLFSQQQSFKFPEVDNVFKESKIQNQGGVIKGLNEPGARYDHDGKIIARSVVGKPEWFIKSNDLSKVNEKALDKRMQRRKSINADNMSVRSQLKEKNKAGVKQFLQSEDRVTKHQLVRELKEIQDRIRKNRKIEKDQLEKIPYFGQVQVTNNERILRQHKQQEEEWIKQIEKHANKMNRDPNLSNIVRADDYWLRKQATGIFDDIKSDFDRFGSRVWINSLRKDNFQNDLNENGFENHEDKGRYHNGLRIVNDIPEAFSKSQVGAHSDQVQIIKRPYLTDPVTKLNNNHNASQMATETSGINPNSSTLRNNNSMGSFYRSYIQNKSDSNLSLFGQSSMNANMVPFNGFRSGEYYFKKLNESSLCKYEPLFNNNTDFESLSVIGQSKLTSEAEMLMKYENHQIFKKKPKQDNPKDFPDEMIEVNYDNGKKANKVYSEFSNKVQQQQKKAYEAEQAAIKAMKEKEEQMLKEQQQTQS